MILGHAFDPVIAAVKERADSGTSYGMPTALETRIAALAIEMVPNIDKIRMVNSGTEACMSAVRLARGVTKREKINKLINSLRTEYTQQRTNLDLEQTITNSNSRQSCRICWT